MRIYEFTYFYPEAPKLLHVESDLFDRLSRDPAWVAEKKYNEQRLELHCNGDFEFWNRHAEKLGYVPSVEVSEALGNVPLRGYCLFDGGLRHNKTKGVRNKIVIYDVYIWESRLLLSMPFKERRNIIEDLFPCEEAVIRVPEHMKFTKATFYDVIKEDEIEGLVLKNLKGHIVPGRTAPVNSNWMFKVREPSGRYKF